MNVEERVRSALESDAAQTPQGGPRGAAETMKRGRRRRTTKRVGAAAVVIGGFVGVVLLAAPLEQPPAITSVSTSTSTTEPFFGFRPPTTVTAVYINGQPATVTLIGDIYEIAEPVNPGDLVQIEVANATPSEVFPISDAEVEWSGGGAISVTFEMPADAESATFPLLRLEDGSVVAIRFVPPEGWAPTVLVSGISGLVGSVGEVITLTLFDRDGPEDIEEVHVNQVFRPQMSEESGPLPPWELVLLITNDELSISLDTESPTLDTWNLVADHPGRYLIEVRVRDRNGNEVDELVAVEVLPSSRLNLRGIGVTMPDTNAPQRIKHLNANLIQIGIGGITPTLTSSEVHNCDFVWTPESPCNTTPPDDLATIIEEAHRWDVQVMLKMNVTFGDYLPSWEQDTDWDAWFSLDPEATSYSNWVLEWAEFAEQHQVEHFVIGNELVKSHVAKEGWTNLIGTVRSLYSGQITYADNYWVFFNNGHDVPFPACHLLDYQGLNFYYRGSGGDVGGPGQNDPSASTMRDNLRAQIEEMFLPAVEFCDNKPVVLTEMTISNYDGANKTPEDTAGFDRRRDDIEQAEFMGAVLEVMRTYPWFDGAVALTYELGPDPDIEWRPAEDMIRIHFTAVSDSVNR